MEKDKKEVKNEANKKIIIPIIALIVLIVTCSIVFLLIQNDKSYEIETVTEFSYFKLYENEKYGVIDTKRECINRAKV